MDLFDTIPHQDLPKIVADMAGSEPWAWIHERMKSGPAGGFGRSGNALAQVIHGFGIEGRGATAGEAAQQWLNGAQKSLDL